MSIRSKFLPALLMAALVVASFSLQRIDTTRVYASDISAEMGQPFSLKINQAARIESADLSLTFLNVTEDSRCPSDVTCVWAGQVTAVIELNSSSGAGANLSLTMGGGQTDTRQFDSHSIKLMDVQPYPISTREISPADYVATFRVDPVSPLTSHSALVKAEGSGVAIVAGWSVEKGIGAAVIFMHDIPKRVVVKFIPSYSESCAHGSEECIDGQVISTTDISFVDRGQKVHAEVDSSMTHLLISSTANAGKEQTLNLTRLKVWTKPVAVGGNSIVSLREGQRDGPLLVQKIYADRIEGLNFPEYPVASKEGFPVTIRIGEKVSNGCTVTLTLFKIEDGAATFLKTVDEHRPCPICWLQRALLGIS